MNLAIVTAIHGRPEITKAFITAMVRLRDTFGIQTYVAVTPHDPSLDLLFTQRISHIAISNKPVGKKFNAAVGLLRDTDFTHLMVLGSDDIPSNGFIEHVLTLDEYDIAGVAGLWFWGLNPRRAGWQRFGYFGISKVMAGAGKIVSRRAVEACDYSPWPDACNYGMDAKMMQRVRVAGRDGKMNLKQLRYDMRDHGGFLVDIKHTHHISSMSPITRRESFIEQDPIEVLPHHLPGEECHYLFDLYNTTRDKWEENK